MNLPSTPIDVTALAALMHATETEIRPLKRLLRTTWTRPMAPEQRQLHALKQRATHLYILRAFLRGKQHLTKQPRPLAHTAWDPAQYHHQMAQRTAERHALGELP